MAKVLYVLVLITFCIVCVRQAFASKPASSHLQVKNVGSRRTRRQLREDEESIEQHNALNMCRKMKTKHGVEIGTSWGTLPQELHKVWHSLRCKFLFRDEGTVAEIDTKNSAATSNVLSETSSSDSSSQGRHVTDDYVKNPPSARSEKQTLVAADSSGRGIRIREGLARTSIEKPDGVKAQILSTDVKEVMHESGSAQEDVALPKISNEDSAWCFTNKEKYGVVPQHSWGTLPESYIDIWKSRRCDMAFTVARMKKNKVSRCEDIETNYNNANKLPLISILAGSTTRKIAKPSTKKLSLFTFLLPSLVRSIDCGFRYEYVLGFDAGDPFYDTEAGMASVEKWFMENVIKPMGRNGIMILPLRKVRVNNTLMKPGPVFLEMARAAYEGGADYFYRINDDTEMVDRWPQVFVNTLKNIPHQVGVVGPTCTQGNVAILTHDFVARSHMDIMQMNYYPPKLVDWWMDDWISYVYGKKRSFKASNVRVVHHVGAHGKRYEVDHSNHQFLSTLLVQGRQHIRNYLLKMGESASVLKAFDQDAALIFTHHDVPK